MYLITGASGHVGTALVGLLVDSGEAVRVLVHDGRVPELPAGVEVVEGDLTSTESMAEALRGVDGMFLLPGYAERGELLAESWTAGVERVVQLSGPAAALPAQQNPITDYLRKSEFAARGCGLDWTILRPAPSMANTLHWVPELATGDVVVEPFASVPVAMIDPLDVAEVAHRALTTGDLDRQTRTLTGPAALLPADRLATLGAALGRELRLQALDRDEARAHLELLMPAPFAASTWSFYGEGLLDESAVDGTVVDVLGRPARSFDQWLDRHVGDFG